MSNHFPDDVFFGADAGAELPEIEQAGTTQLDASLWEDTPSETLPSDASFMRDDERGLGDLGGVMTAGVQNLDWLEVDEQDPERLPKNTETGTVIPELEEAWGTELQAGARHHALDREALAYQASLEKEPEQKKMAAAEVRWIVQRALRRSAAGHPLRDIVLEAAKAMGPERSRIKAAMG